MNPFANGGTIKSSRASDHGAFNIAGNICGKYVIVFDHELKNWVRGILRRNVGCCVTLDERRLPNASLFYLEATMVNGSTARMLVMEDKIAVANTTSS
jgi:hypothetical protein